MNMKSPARALVAEGGATTRVGDNYIHITSSFPREASLNDENSDDEKGGMSFSSSSKSRLLLPNSLVLFFGVVVVVAVVATPTIFGLQGGEAKSFPQQKKNRLLLLRRNQERQKQQQVQREERGVTLVPPVQTCPVRFNKTAQEMVTTISHVTPDEENLLCHSHTEKSMCHCHAPTKARKPSMSDWDEVVMGSYGPWWEATSRRNHEWASRTPADGGAQQYDVVFLGDSIIEHFQGTDLNQVMPRWTETKRVFDSFFDPSQGGTYHGIALGIGGDMAPQLQYRIQHEIPKTFDAKVFWVLIGTNDIGQARCSGEAVAAGNVRIVETILKRWPNSRVVLNSFLPRGRPGKSLFHYGRYPLWESHAEVTNRWLECYAESPENNERVDFFNATDYFLDYGKSTNATTTVDGGVTAKTKEDYPILVEDYYADGVHPSAMGCRKWLEGVVSHLRNNMGIEAQ